MFELLKIRDVGCGSDPMDDLHARAKRFLSGPHPLSDPGWTLQRLISRYVAGETWEDPELRKLLSDYLQAARREAARLADARPGPEGDAWRFYQGAAEILEGIQAQVASGGA
jgi:hypothetical protein